MAQTALRLHHLHHLLERRILVIERLQCLLPDLPQQLTHCLLRINPRAQRQRVHKEPDQPFQLAAPTIRHRRADHNVILAAEPAQQHRPRRLQHHEQRRSMSPTQRMQPLAQLRTQLEAHHRPCIPLDRRPCVICRQLQQRRGSRQPFLPVRQLLGQPLTRQPLPLPLRIVHILNRQRRQHQRQFLFAPKTGCIQCRKLLRQHPHRPAIRHDVVHAHKQHMLPPRQPDQLATDQRPLRQIKTLCRCTFQFRLQLTLTLLLRQHRQILPCQHKARCCLNHLMRLCLIV